jgi:flavin reductase (DIM6/NTAB) family NADH-FMN oxidoreductase RutF
MTVDQRSFRDTMGLFATGVTVITARAGDTTRGMTANSVTSVSLDPLLLLVCVDRRAAMAAVIREAERFAVNILRADQEDISRHFAGRPQPNREPALVDLAGAPTLADSMATIVCAVDRILDGGDHLIVLGRVDALRQAGQPGEPLLYYRGRYHTLADEQAPAAPRRLAAD